MKTCVVYAAYIPDSTKLNVIREFFSVFKHKFQDADFYIGINPGSVPNLESVINEYNLNTKITYVPEELHTKTDASAFQSALNNIGINKAFGYDVYWFGHTKGGVNSRENERYLYLNEFFSKRQEIEQMFESYSELGSWGIRGNAMNSLKQTWDTYNVDCGLPICGNVKWGNFQYTHVNWSYVETMYALKGKPVESFIKSSPTEFFTTKLNPWYFETVMSWVPSRCGYFPYVKHKRCFWDTADLMDITKKWIGENNLTFDDHLLSI